jgi:hypothetical protein
VTVVSSRSTVHDSTTRPSDSVGSHAGVGPLASRHHVHVVQVEDVGGNSGRSGPLTRASGIMAVFAVDLLERH